MAKHKDGILGSNDRPGIGLPDRIAEPTVFMLDFMPFEERTIQEYGVVIDHIYFWDDALRPWIHTRDAENSKHPRKFTFRIKSARHAGNLFSRRRKQQLHSDPIS